MIPALDAKTVQKAAAIRLDVRLARQQPMRPLLIGQAPGRGLDGWPALTGRAGDRLAELAGLSYPGARGALALMLATERMNVFDVFPGDPSLLAAAVADLFPSREAANNAYALLVKLMTERRLAGRQLIFVGRAVAAAFALPDLPFYAWVQKMIPDHMPDGGQPYTVSCVPHPSGRNRYWNEPDNVRRASNFLRAALNHRPGPPTLQPPPQAVPAAT